jgi:GAF domain-containing protein
MSSLMTDPLRAASDVSQTPTIARALEAVRDLLDMDIAYSSEHIGDVQHIRLIEGDPDTPSGELSDYTIPLADSYCKRILEGELPNLIADTAANPATAAMPVTEDDGIGAFCSVPLLFSDGRLYGTLCAESSRRREEFGPRDLDFMHVFARIIADQLEREELARKAHRLELENTAATAILAAVAARDSYTADHSYEVVECALAVALELGLDEDELQQVRQVALLHDIGKIAIPDAILRKPGPLDPDELEIMRGHSIESERIVAALPGLRHLAAAVRAEHERFDGTGYPDQLAGERIPLASRITLVSDAYHAMVSDRPYRAALPIAEARRRIAEGAGTQFCPRVAQALLATLPE